MNTTHKIGIVIVNWNSGSQLAEAIHSVEKYHHGLVESVVIVDNASTDCSLSLVKASVGGGAFSLEIIRNAENRGFGAACNQGAEALKSCSYVLFLNPDARLLHNSLLLPLNYLQDVNHSHVGIVGVQLINDLDLIDSSCSRFPSPLRFTMHAIGLDRILPRFGCRMKEWSHADTRKVDQVMGAFFFIRHQVFQNLKGFDERFFVYYEEVDVSYRAMKSGWSSVYLADAQAFHAGEGTSKQVKAMRLFYSLRSRLIYASKHFSLFGFIVTLFATVLIEPITRVALSATSRSSSSLAETLSGFKILFRWLATWALHGETR